MNYMNRDAKESAYNEVEEDLNVYGITRDKFKLKWKEVRGQFMREVGQEKKTLYNKHGRHCCNCRNIAHACNSDSVHWQGYARHVARL